MVQLLYKESVYKLKSINDEELLKSLHENAIKLSNPKVLDEIVKEIEKL